MSLTGSSRDHTTRPTTVTAHDGLGVQVCWHGRQCCVITVAGELDVATAPDLMESLREILEESPQRLVIDLDQVTFLDSTGLGVLVSAHQRMSARAGGLVFVCHSRSSLKVMQITGLTRVFTYAPSVEEAVTGRLAEADPRSTHC
jgi:anti-sigma B factor antagonist